MTPQRLATIKASLNRRQPDLTVIMENVRKPHNLAAVARTLEAVGGMQIHAITELTRIRLSQMSAGGVRKWISVHKHPDTKQGLAALKQQGLRIIATALDETAIDYREIDYTGPTAILVGEELEGISPQALEMADSTIVIPMKGMVQSLNVSVATALVLFEAMRQRDRAGMYEHCALDKENYTKLLFEACHPRIANYCREKNLPYPPIDENGELVAPVGRNELMNNE